MKFLTYILIGCLGVAFACTPDRSKDKSVAASLNPISPTKPIEKTTYNEEEASALIKAWVDSTTIDQSFPKINEEKVAPQLAAFYSSRAFERAWTIPTAQQLVESLQSLDQEGLNPEAFPISQIQALMDSVVQGHVPAATGARLDVLLSATYLKLADMLATGKVKPSQVSSEWHIRQDTPDTLLTHLQQATAGQVKASLDSFRPGMDQYSWLRSQLNTYQRIVEEGGWPTVEAGPELAPGDSSQRMVAIRKRLHATGDLTVSPAQWQQPAVYDSSLMQAVNRYQQRNGLEVKPEITKEMVQAMNVPASQRLKQIMLNLDRIRWISTGAMPDTYVLVNIPEFQLHVIEKGREIKTMKVVVGKTMNSTPVFSDKIEHVEFSPYWNVPNSIANQELWPKIRRSRSYLSRNHYEILDGWGPDARVVSRSRVNWGNLDSYRIRQKPGPWNALGDVKFMFPNQYAIYLHDTPAEHLFDKTYRAFSHGCIRIEEPAWFADWLFPQFNREEVKAKMSDQQHEVIKLDEKVPVYIVYLTAFEDKDGLMNFRQDLYGMDERLTPEFDVMD